jgi:hypothetical protein
METASLTAIKLEAGVQSIEFSWVFYSSLRKPIESVL